MGIDSSTPSLFDQFPEQNGVSEPVLSPSEKFRLDNPDFIEPIPVVHEWDPNARRADKLRGSGGGLAAAVAGELAIPAQADIVVNVEAPTQQDETEAVDEPVIKPEFLINSKIDESKETVIYGHVEGASARVLRASDQSYLRSQYREQGRNRR